MILTQRRSLSSQAQTKYAQLLHDQCKSCTLTKPLKRPLKLKFGAVEAVACRGTYTVARQCAFSSVTAQRLHTRLRSAMLYPSAASIASLTRLWVVSIPAGPFYRTRAVAHAQLQEKTTNHYFLDSAADVSFFFEEGAFKPDGSLVQDKARSINKCGHALHDLDPAFRKFSRSDRMATVFKALGFRRPLPVQSMYIFKQPKIGGPVVPHQDRCDLHPQGQTCLQPTSWRHLRKVICMPTSIACRPHYRAHLRCKLSHG